MSVGSRTFVDENPATREELAELEDADAESVDRAVRPIRTSGIEALAGQLSGGNQQKVALARALESNPRILLLEEPTQGIDVHAKSEIRALIKSLPHEEGEQAW